MAIQRKETQTKKRWPRYCMIAALIMVVIAVVLYFWVYIKTDSEFSAVSSYYGDRYEELFDLSTPDQDVKKEILSRAEEAFAFVGSRADCEAFGVLSRYCTSLESYPTAAKVDYELEQIAGKTGDTVGYLWVAYTCRVYDANGVLLTASGSAEQRILSRWTVEKINGSWLVTGILEHP